MANSQSVPLVSKLEISNMVCTQETYLKKQVVTCKFLR